MQKKYYTCDGGSLAIGAKDLVFCVINCYGDGEHAVEVYNGFRSCERSRDTLRFMGTVTGTEIKVFDYDCLTEEERADPKHILFTLAGRYGIYARENSGDIILEKWE